MTIHNIIKSIRKDFRITRLEHLEKLNDRGISLPNERRLTQLVSKDMNLKISVVDHLLKSIGYKLQVVPIEDGERIYNVTQNGFHYEDEIEED